MDFPNLSTITATTPLRPMKTIAPPELCRSVQIIKLETFFAEWEKFKFVNVEENADQRFRQLHRSGDKQSRVHTAILSPDIEDQEGYVIVAKPCAALDAAKKAAVLIEYFPNDTTAKPLFTITQQHKSEDWSER